jgi:hypothetical protein
MAYPRRQNAHISDGADVTTSSAVIVEEFPQRLELTIVNTHATVDVSLKLRTTADAGADPTAVAGDGILLKANGGSWTTTSYTGPVAAIAASASTVGVTEI